MDEFHMNTIFKKARLKSYRIPSLLLSPCAYIYIFFLFFFFFKKKAEICGQETDQ